LTRSWVSFFFWAYQASSSSYPFQTYPTSAPCLLELVLLNEGAMKTPSWTLKSRTHTL
jgi:hypothetical protein